LLFGIQQEGKLGNASELKTAYEIFKNTYVTHKQKQIEEITGYFSSVAGVDAEYKLKDVEPVGMELDPVQFKELLPKEWILEKFGIDPAKYGIQTAVNNVMPEQMGNEALIKLSGRQQQNLMRIVRLFSQGKLTKGQASIQLSAYGFTNDQINQYLGVDADSMTTDEQFMEDSDEFIADMFAEYGDDRENYTILKSEVYTGQDDDFKMTFEAFSEYTERELKIMELLKKQPDLSNEQIAETLDYEKNIVDDIIENLIKLNVIAAVVKGGKPIRTIGVRLPEQTLPEIKVLYTYEKRDGVSGPELLKTSRPFCVKMVGLSKSRMFSRQDIQKLSERLGYSVFKRAGGYWNNNGTIEFQCRHGWMKHVVIKKK
jgi:DNA-binding NarL/FixJ family response regulator